METLREFQVRALHEFLLRGFGDKARKEFHGELPDTNIFDITYWYGNGEIIATNEHCSTTWEIYHNGFNYSWVIAEEHTEEV